MSGIVAQNVGRHTGLVKAAGGGGAWTLIETITSDGSDATISFTSGLDSTYDEYYFKFIGIHPETDGADFTMNFSVDGGSNYNVTKTSTYFHAEHNESDSGTDLGYYVSRDLAQGTGFQTLQQTVGSDNDQSASGYMYLYQPSSTTFVKHFISQISNYKDEDYNQNTFVAGYGNTTSAVNAIQFKMSADEIQGGSISMYGIG